MACFRKNKNRQVGRRKGGGGGEVMKVVKTNKHREPIHFYSTGWDQSPSARTMAVWKRVSYNITPFDL